MKTPTDEQVKEAQLTLLKAGLPIVLKAHNKMADATPIKQVIVYPIWEVIHDKS